jgi:SAM-dependent methyltransferase
MRIALATLLTLALGALAADRMVAPYAIVKPVLEALASELPPELKEPDEPKWSDWAQREDNAIRARLEQGALDSMVNLLLFGTSFTTQPRFEAQEMIHGSEKAILESRLRDLLQGLRAPGKNERLIFLRSLLGNKGMDPDTSAGYEKTKAFVLENLGRVAQEMTTFTQRFDESQRQSDRYLGLSERSRILRDRGVSLDTTILPSFGIDEALRDMKNRGALRNGQITRVAVIGPGLDFIDKKSGYDYYPEQTLQPFALYDSLVRLELAKAGMVNVTVFDISSRVLDHLRRARDRAKAGGSYVVQLPRETRRPWASEAVQYWRSFGNQIGVAVAPIKPPGTLLSLETRAVGVRRDVVLSCAPMDLDVVFDRIEMPADERFDLVVATNIFVYYDTLEQALALQNVSTLLKPGGFLLSNDWLPPLPEVPMRSVGYTFVRYAEGASAGDNIFWWKR